MDKYFVNIFINLYFMGCTDESASCYGFPKQIPKICCPGGKVFGLSIRTFKLILYFCSGYEDYVIVDRCPCGGCGIGIVGTWLAQRGDELCGDGLYEAVPVVGCADDCAGGDYHLCHFRL